MRITDEMALFFSERDSFSNWHRSEFVVRNIQFNCVEQFMMFSKAKLFADEATARKILEADNPRDQKSLGRAVSNYDDTLWCERRGRIVAAGCMAKFTQNPFIREELLATGNRLLVEASPYDTIWGVGLGENDPRILNPANWKGQNLLGVALSEVRAILANNMELKGKNMKEYESYKELTASPEAHLDFMKVISANIDEGLGGRNLYDRLSKEVSVAGKPFSQAFHLNNLENASGNWDFDEVPDPIKLEIVKLTSKIKDADPGYDLAHFTIAYEYMISDMKERGVNVDAGLDHSEPAEKKVVSGSDYEPRM